MQVRLSQHVDLIVDGEKKQYATMERPSTRGSLFFCYFKFHVTSNRASDASLRFLQGIWNGNLMTLHIFESATPIPFLQYHLPQQLLSLRPHHNTHHYNDSSYISDLSRTCCCCGPLCTSFSRLSTIIDYSNKHQDMGVTRGKIFQQCQSTLFVSLYCCRHGICLDHGTCGHDGGISRFGI